MPRSTLTVKYQTTVPKEVREKLGAHPGDVLQWEVVGEHVRITAAAPAFLALQGRFKVGPGDPVEDVRRARERRERGSDFLRYLEEEVWPKVPPGQLGRRLSRDEEDEILGYGSGGV